MKTQKYSTTINNNKINLDLQKSGGLKDCYVASFKVNDTYIIDKDLSKKDKYQITKWLLKTWKEFLSNNEFKLVVCVPFDKDGEADYRFNIYYKLGFKYVNPAGTMCFMKSDNPDFISQYKLRLIKK